MESTAVRRREVVVEIPVSSRKANTSRKPSRGSSTDLVEGLNRIKLNNSDESSGTGDAQFSLASLLKDCSSSTVHPFSAFLASSTFLSLVSPKSTSPTKAHKIGEASYSEVFSFSTGNSAPQAVVKVIPLFDEALLRPDDRDEVELPDCSSPCDVLREIQITQKMAGLPGGGFVDFFGCVYS